MSATTFFKKKLEKKTDAGFAEIARVLAVVGTHNRVTKLKGRHNTVGIYSELHRLQRLPRIVATTAKSLMPHE